MKAFRTFLIEKAMPPEEAMRILGLKPGFTSDELNAAWKKAARENHPDRGGDVRKMQDINNAADSLRNRGQSAASVNARANYEKQRNDFDEKMNALRPEVMKSFETKYDPEAFSEHFAKVFGEPFYGTHNGKWWNGREDRTHVIYQQEWYNEGKTTVLSMNVFIGLTDLINAKVLAAPDDFLTMSITTEILHNRKKVKLSQRDWQMRREAKVLSDPELLFPTTKLQAQVKKSAGRAMSKRDVLLTFQKELGATISYSDQPWVYVPFKAPTGIEFKVAMYRVTFMGEASWAIQGVYAGHRMTDRTKEVGFIPENQAAMTLLWDDLKTLRTSFENAHMPPYGSDLAKALDQLIRQYKQKAQG